MLTCSSALRRTALAACLVCALAAAAFAASPVFWTVSSQSDFLKGDVEDLSIDSDGRVFLGPSATLVAETSAPFLWSIVAGPDGTIWTGSGNEGKVLAIDRNGKISTFFDATELEVHAIAPARDGGLYVGTSPDGKVYLVARDGTSKVLFDPDDKYIWALASDKGGNVYAATGDQGTIYKITPDGKGTPFYKTSATNVVSLAIAPNGDVIAGTESPGRIFRIGGDGKAFVLLDSAFREIHALRLASDGTIFAAAISGPSGGSDRPPDTMTTDTSRPAVASVSTEITSVAVGESQPSTPAPAPTPMPRSSRRAPRGAIYRIQPDGLWDTVWETSDDTPYDLLLEEDGSLLVGTGTEGKIFRVAGSPARATLLARAAARQITALIRDESGRIVGVTSNPGKVFTLSSSPAKRGTYESEVRDAGTVATWGVIRWRATARSGQVQIATRSGNTATPDETWSAWSEPYTDFSGEQITSPNARYLQWRATLTRDGGDGPILTSVTAAYLPRNLRPQVVSITVHPPGTVFQRPFSSADMEIAGYEDNTSDGRPPTPQAGQQASSSTPPSPTVGRRHYQKGLQTFVWRAEDENGDRLQYDAFYRREGETEWRPLRRGLWDPIFVWDTTSVPDGTYVVKIAASDAAANSPGTALTGEKESASFEIDNSPPAIEIGAAGARSASRRLTFVVRDDHSPIQRVEYSLDASRWRIVYPKDGIPDSRREEFEITLEPGETVRNVIIRATDAMNNVATAVSDVAEVKGRK